MLLQFTLSPDEYITEVNGYYKTVFSGDVITALTFKTNKKTYGTYGDKTRSYFSLNAPKDKQIAGFFGSSSNALNSIDAHFAPLPPPGSTTGTNSGTGGTGSNLGGNSSGNTGGSNAGSTGTNPGTGGTETNPVTGGTGTNPGTGGTGSNPGGNSSSTNDTGGSNAGSTGTNPGTGTGSNPGGSSSNTGSNTNSSPQKVEAQGGKGGNQWDDGADHDGVMKILVAPGGQGVEQIRFDYVKNGQLKEGPAHGVKGRSVDSTVRRFLSFSFGSMKCFVSNVNWSLL